nr:hypothetical protein [Acholeplasmatales bacterium]
GTVLLLLPISSRNDTSITFVDALFMSTSATCVTGLATINVASSLSVFGYVVMCILMEIGGLSLITIGVFIFSIIGAKIGVSDRILIKEALNQNSVKGVVGLVRKIVLTSFIIQAVGVIINMFGLVPYYNNFFKALGISVFHSIASFNNAGFDIFGDNSMIEFSNNIILNSSTILMIILGSMGFVVINDILMKKRWKNLTLHSKITIITSIFLIIGGTFLIKISINSMTWMESIFTSVTTRTAGFTTVDMSNLPPAAFCIISGLMFIGASPCSTGGGIKTTTFAIILISIVYFASGKRAHAFKRQIPRLAIFKAFVLFVVAILAVGTCFFLISIIQPELQTEKIMFEVISAFSTTGLSMGITPYLNSASKIIISLLMLFGRLGPLTIIGVVNKHFMSDTKENLKYVEEGVIIG